MLPSRFHARIRRAVQWLQRFVDRVWYPPVLGLLAALDNLLIIIPNDGLLISSSMLTPRRWFVLAFSAAVGSTVGALMLAWIAETQGLPWILHVYPGIDQSVIWDWSVRLFEGYGLLLVLGVSLTPIMQHPAVILASLAHTPPLHLAAVVFAGRSIKFLIMAYVASHAPKLLKKFWGLRGELEDTGVDLR